MKRFADLARDYIPYIESGEYEREQIEILKRQSAAIDYTIKHPALVRDICDFEGCVRCPMRCICGRDEPGQQILNAILEEFGIEGSGREIDIDADGDDFQDTAEHLKKRLEKMTSTRFYSREEVNRIIEEARVDIKYRALEENEDIREINIDDYLIRG